MTIRIAAMAAGLSLVAGAAAAATVYSNDFESGIGAGISGWGVIAPVEGYEGVNGISGNFLVHHPSTQHDQFTGLSLTGLAAHTSLTISFDFAAIASWDGASGSYSPDFFNIVLDGVTTYTNSVDNFRSFVEYESVPGVTTNYTRSYDFWPTNPWPDSAMTISLTAAHSAPNATLGFFPDGAGFQSWLGDEFWAMDNLSISINSAAVPLPMGLPLLAGALGLLGLVARRNRGRG